MKKVKLLTALIFCGTAVFSQIFTPVNPTQYGNHSLREKPDSVQGIPTKDTVRNTTDTITQVCYKIETPKSIWVWSRHDGWFNVGASGGVKDTTLNGDVIGGINSNIVRAILGDSIPNLSTHGFLYNSVSGFTWSNPTITDVIENGNNVNNNPLVGVSRLTLFQGSSIRQDSLSHTNNHIYWPDTSGVIPMIINGVFAKKNGIVNIPVGTDSSIQTGIGLSQSISGTTKTLSLTNTSVTIANSYGLTWSSGNNAALGGSITGTIDSSKWVTQNALKIDSLALALSNNWTLFGSEIINNNTGNVSINTPNLIAYIGDVNLNNHSTLIAVDDADSIISLSAGTINNTLATLSSGKLKVLVNSSSETNSGIILQPNTSAGSNTFLVIKQNNFTTGNTMTLNAPQSGTSFNIATSVNSIVPNATNGNVVLNFTGGDIISASAGSNVLNYSNVVPANKGGAGTINAILKANGSGTVSAATAGSDYQAPLTLTTTGTSGAATLTGTTLNIPNYAPGTGTVTAVSIATANGISGTSSGGATPALTVSLGAITPTSVNGCNIATATADTVAVANGKKLTVSNTLILSGTDNSTLNVGTGGTLKSAALTDSNTNVRVGSASAAGNVLIQGNYVSNNFTAGSVGYSTALGVAAKIGFNWVGASGEADFGGLDGSGGFFVAKSNGVEGLRVDVNSRSTLIGTIINIPSSQLTVRSATKASSPIPLYTTSAALAISSLIQSDEVYDSTIHKMRVHNGTSFPPLLDTTSVLGSVSIAVTQSTNGNLILSTKGEPAIVASNYISAQTTAQTISTYTTGAADSSYSVSAGVDITALSINVVTTTITYTDETNTSRTVTLYPMGSTSATLTTGPTAYSPLSEIRVKASTTITLAVTATGAGSQTYNAWGSIVKLHN